MSHQNAINALNSQFNALTSRITELEGENNRLTVQVDSLKNENQLLRQAGVSLVLQPVQACDAVLAGIHMPVDVRTLNIMSLSNLKSAISRAYADLNRIHAQNVSAIAHNKRIVDGVIALLSSLGIEGTVTGQYDSKQHRRWSVAEPVIVTQLKAAVAVDDNYEVVKATLKSYELRLVSTGNAVRTEVSIPEVLRRLAGQYGTVANANSILEAICHQNVSGEIALAVAVEAFRKAQNNPLIRQALSSQIAAYRVANPNMAPQKNVVLHAFVNALQLGVPLNYNESVVLNWAPKQFVSHYQELRPFLING